MATIEPVFSTLESVMGFRRVTTRVTEAVLAEIALEVLAYNIGRLIARRPSRVLSIVLLPPDLF